MQEKWTETPQYPAMDRIENVSLTKLKSLLLADLDENTLHSTSCFSTFSCKDFVLYKTFHLKFDEIHVIKCSKYSKKMISAFHRNHEMLQEW